VDVNLWRKRTNMLGAYLVFGVAVALVVTYMMIVHKFLVAAEDPADRVRQRASQERPTAAPARESGARAQYAH
jgi:hypothetical protein